MASIQDYWPAIQATLQVGSPLIWGAIAAEATRQGARTMWRVAPLILITFPLLWARGRDVPGPAAWAIPMACWLAALLTVRSPRLALRAAFLLATGVSTAALQLWQLLR